MQHATFQFTMAGQKTNPSPIKSICWWNCWEITGCQTWDKCSSAAQCLGRLKRGWVSVTHGAQPEVIWHGTWRRTVQFWTPKWHEASRSYRHAMVIGFRWFAMCFLYLLIPSWLRTQWSVPRGPWQFAQNPSLPVIDPAAGCCPLYPPYTLQSCGAIWAVFFLLSGSVYSCAAYATVYAMPTRPQWEPTRLIPLKVCLRRPNARIKRRHNVCFCLRRHTSVCFWKVGNGTFAYATTVPFTFLQHERPGSKAPIDILQPHPCSSRTSNQVPKRTLNIWWINHDKSLKTQLVTFDYAGVKPSDVFDCR